jgi:hypothetical protein
VRLKWTVCVTLCAFRFGAIDLQHDDLFVIFHAADSTPVRHDVQNSAQVTFVQLWWVPDLPGVERFRQNERRAKQTDAAIEIRKAYQSGLTRRLQFMADALANHVEDAEDSIDVHVKREMQTWIPELMAQQIEMFKAAKAGK